MKLYNHCSITTSFCFWENGSICLFLRKLSRIICYHAPNILWALGISTIVWDLNSLCKLCEQALVYEPSACALKWYYELAWSRTLFSWETWCFVNIACFFFFFFFFNSNLYVHSSLKWSQFSVIHLVLWFSIRMWHLNWKIFPFIDCIC